MQRLIIIDSNNLCYIHRFALSSGLSYRGGRTEIIYGFLKSILDIAEHLQSNQFAFAWDSKQSIRKEMYPEYKEQRVKQREELSEEDREKEMIAFKQFDQLRRDVLPAIGFSNVFRKKGYESDDIIASIVNTRRCIVVSGDEDLYQLLDLCSIYNTRKHEILTGKMFRRIYKIAPEDWIMVKQLGGCTSDSIKGILGIGQGRALSYVRGVLKGKMRERIDSEEGNAIRDRNKPLVALPLEGIGNFPIQEDTLLLEDFKDVCKKFGLKSFLKPENLQKWEKVFDME